MGRLAVLLAVLNPRDGVRENLALLERTDTSSVRNTTYRLTIQKHLSAKTKKQLPIYTQYNTYTTKHVFTENFVWPDGD
jgi:hypothetical protein